MMSHQEYVDQSDEDQLHDLITRASARIAGIQASGWVKLWAVSMGGGNEAWFPASERDAAVAWICERLPKRMEKRPDGHGIEMELSLERYRPEEADELLARNKPKAKS